MTQPVLVPRSTLDVVLTCDPAISEKSDACRSAVTVWAMSPYSKIFLLDYWVGRQGDPYLLCQTILELAIKHQPRLIGIEAVGYQQALKPFLEREMLSRNLWMPVENLKPDRNEKKAQRIQSMQPFFRTGQVYVQKGMLDFLDEYEAFPNGRTCDILDASAYAFRLLVPPTPSTQPSLELKLKELSRVDPGAARYWRRDAEKRGLLEAERDPLDDESSEDITYVEGIAELV